MVQNPEDLYNKLLGLEVALTVHNENVGSVLNDVLKVVKDIKLLYKHKTGKEFEYDFSKVYQISREIDVESKGAIFEAIRAIEICREAREIAVKQIAADLYNDAGMKFIDLFSAQEFEIMEEKESSANEEPRFPDHIMDRLKEMVEDENEIEHLTPREVFDLLLRYEGILGYTSKIIDWYEICFKEEKKGLRGGDSRE